MERKKLQGESLATCVIFPFSVSDNAYHLKWGAHLKLIHKHTLGPTPSLAPPIRPSRLESSTVKAKSSRTSVHALSITVLIDHSHLWSLW